MANLSIAKLAAKSFELFPKLVQVNGRINNRGRIFPLKFVRVNILSDFKSTYHGRKPGNYAFVSGCEMLTALTKLDAGVGCNYSIGC
jgi:hypothetical protein